MEIIYTASIFVCFSISKELLTFLKNHDTLLQLSNLTSITNDDVFLLLGLRDQTVNLS